MSEIALIGDIAFNGLISSEPEKNNKRYEEIIPILNQPGNLVFANLEVPVKLDETKNEYKDFIHYSLPVPTADLLKMLNIGCVSLANNHIYDCKMPGLKATIKTLDDLGIYHTGAGWKQEQIEPVIIVQDGQKIAFLAFVDVSTNPKTEDFPELYINYLKPSEVINEIKSLRKKVDKIICSIHWGKDYSNFYTREQKITSHAIIDAGADIIMGHHPHTVQTYEIYNKKLIFYSLGQLCFGDFIREGHLQAIKRKTKKGMIINVKRFDPITIKVIPTLEKPGNDIVLLSNNIDLKLNYYAFINNIFLKYRLVKIFVSFKEVFLDRFIEYFFGYYRHPFKNLFLLKTWRMGLRIFKSNKDKLANVNKLKGNR